MIAENFLIRRVTRDYLGCLFHDERPSARSVSLFWRRISPRRINKRCHPNTQLAEFFRGRKTWRAGLERQRGRSQRERGTRRIPRETVHRCRGSGSESGDSRLSIGGTVVSRLATPNRLPPSAVFTYRDHAPCDSRVHFLDAGKYSRRSGSPRYRPPDAKSS